MCVCVYHLPYILESNPHSVFGVFLIVWEDDVEDKDVSDWVESMDNDSGMSNDGESDE